MGRFATWGPLQVLLVTALVLSVAVAGSAIGGSGATTSDVSKSKVKRLAKQQAKKQIRKQVLNTEAYREVGAAGQPDFLNDWENAGFGAATAAFYKDALGVVHLKGTIRTETGNGGVAFTLPAGYRPSQELLMPMAASFSYPEAGLVVHEDGRVVPACNTPGNDCFGGISGLSFRAD
jgi:hypothetical protein